MKSVKILVIILFIVSFSINAYSQLWKQYSDSAKAFNDQNKTNKAIEYYYKAKKDLEKDSMWTKTYARTCNIIGVLFYNMGQYAKAEPLYVETKQIWEKVLGKEHPFYAGSCSNLAVLYKGMGQYAKAEPLFIEAKFIFGKVLGNEDPKYAGICNNLAVLYMDMGQYEKAEPLYIEAKQIDEKVLGKKHPDYASDCYNLAILYSNVGQNEKAEKLYIEAKQIREKVFGKNHPEYATVCENLAILYRDMGHYKMAEPLLLEAKQINEKVFGKNHPEYAKSCNNLARLYFAMGQYEKAELLYLEAKDIREKVYGKEDPAFASSCDALAILYLNIGQFGKAEPLYIEAKKIREKVLGKKHPSYSNSCNNLAILYKNMGQYEKAESFYLEAKLIQEIALVQNLPEYASTCNNLAILYASMRQYQKAKSLFLEAMQIMEKVLGKEHPDYAGVCDGLANLYSDMDQYEKAEPLYLEAKQIREKVLGKEHPDYAGSCYNMGKLYSDMGQYEKSLLFSGEAYNSYVKVLGKEHPMYVESCINLGNLYQIINNYPKAKNFYTEGIKSQNIQLKKIFQFTSEVEQQSYLKKIANNKKIIFSLITSDYYRSNQGFAYNISLSSHNLMLSASQKLRNTIYNSGDTGLKNKYNSWINLREQISFWNIKPIAERPAYVKDREEQSNTLEKELTVLSSDFKTELQKKEVNWKVIQKNLKTTEASIEFVEFNYFDGKRWTDSTYYIALLLRKDKPEPMLVRLFENKQLDTLLKSVENQITENRINTLYAGNRSLYNLTWKPLEKYLTGISKVYYASAGDLFKISFAALLVNDKQVLGDKYRLIQLNTTASLTDNTHSILTATDKIQLYGGIKYDADSASLKQAVAVYQSNTKNTRSLPADLERGASFKYLPGTQRETEAIKNQTANTGIGFTMLSGTNATEESLKSLTGKNSPSVLHIATHGFFFPDPKNDKRDEVQRKFETSGKAFKQSDNPLFRSGLLFAGANNAWQGKPIDGIEDGILTAYEVSNLYLPNTKLVVLSACETALGDIQGSEGVYGLQRSFKMAGVQNLVMSLWKVPDAETSEFMQLFYKNLFAKQTISNAFYIAQQVMKNKYRAEPYKWAAWVLVR